MILRSLLAFLTSLVMTVVIMPPLIFLTKKLKFRQTILQYVDNHSLKSGTPTMGGIGFVFSAILSTSFFIRGGNVLVLLCMAVTGAYAIIGFLDDFIKVFFKQNKGLSPWQKILFQTSVAVIVSIAVYNNPNVGDMQFISPYFGLLEMGVFAIPLYVVIFLAGSNSVNLIDRVDGLASSVTATFLTCFTLIITISSAFLGINFASDAETANVVVFACSLTGALIGFLCYNTYPAKIFMGDTGSLALGGALSVMTIVTRLAFSFPVIGIMYVVTSLSVIIQVAYFKMTKKRVFLMTPIHHHFERKGVHENRIVKWYSLVTLTVGLALLSLILAVN